MGWSPAQYPALLIKQPHFPTQFPITLSPHHLLLHRGQVLNQVQSNGAICGKYNFVKYNIFSQAWKNHVACHGESLSDLARILFDITFKEFI